MGLTRGRVVESSSLREGGVVWRSHGAPRAPSLTTLVSLAVLALLVVMSPRASAAPERGAVLILSADCVDSTCIVSSYGAGFIVRVDEERRVAHVLTARHVVGGFSRVYVLYDPMSFPSDYAQELASGGVPVVLANALEDRGHPRPTNVRSGLNAGGGGRVRDRSLILQTESWVLSGQGSEYLAVPGDERLDVFQLLPAVVERQSMPAMDVALLAVEDFPRGERSPVLYMSTPGPIPIGTDVTTFGCECGLAEGLSQAEARGAAVLGDPGFLLYESELVSPGFSGGPVMIGDHVVAMNLTEDLRTGSRVRARLASELKGLVDSWIGLPRMKVDLIIASPEGARDGVVSTRQDFLLRADARLDSGGQLLAPLAEIRLDLPSPYQAHGGVVEVLSAGEERNWTVSAPEHVTDPLPIRLYGRDPSLESDSMLLAEATVSTEEGIQLRGVLAEGPRDGATLFRGDAVPVVLRFEQSGQPLTEVSGVVTIEVADHQFAIQGVQPSRAIALDAPVEWELKTLDESVGAPISFRASLQNLDHNDRAIGVELPETVTIRVREGWGFRAYWGVGRLSLGGSGKDSDGSDELGKRSQGESKGEMEFGAKFRVSNVMQRGIPLCVVLAGGLGLDDTWEKNTEGSEGPAESLIADWRAWVGAGLSAGLGPVEACLDAGYIRLGRYLDDNLPTDLEERYEAEGVSGAFVRPGVELALSPRFSVYAGGRTIFALDDTEYYLQLRFQNGK